MFYSQRSRDESGGTLLGSWEEQPDDKDQCVYDAWPQRPGGVTVGLCYHHDVHVTDRSFVLSHQIRG